MRGPCVALAALVAAVGACVDDAKPERAEHVIVVDGPQGQVEVRLVTPEEVSPGEDRELWRYDAENLSPNDQSVAVGVALDGLPEGCVIDDELWSEVSDDADCRYSRNSTSTLTSGSSARSPTSSTSATTARERSISSFEPRSWGRTPRRPCESPSAWRRAS